MKANTVFRFKAAGLHFFASAALIAAFVYIVLSIWYPVPFDYFYNPITVLLIVFSVDVILGPLLTFILYDVTKKISELRMDISLVIVIQLLAFIWGAYVTYNARPVVLVFSNKEFLMFSANEVDMTTVKVNELKPVFWQPPKQVYLDPVSVNKNLEQLYREYFVEGKPEITARSDLYLPLSEGFHDLLKYSIDLELIRQHAEANEDIKHFLQGISGQYEDYAYFPVRGTSKQAILVFRRDTGDIAGLIKTTITDGNIN